ncbi:hypothetical protein [Zoogloea sp.]|uniref:hypothetical protein n=1 Tax=Zoogloea sp. TaxID=49181 RepID=UPI00263730FC|nr:hypothetical protein [Zoogloea sp.]
MMFPFGTQDGFSELDLFLQISGRFVFYAKKDKNVLKVNVMPAQVKKRQLPGCGRL